MNEKPSVRLTWKASVSITVVIGLTMLACNRANQSPFEVLLREVRYDEDWESIESKARTLREQPACIVAAIENLTLTGGRSALVSSWVLITSRQTELIELKLEDLASSSTEPLGRRIAAVRVLWARKGRETYVEALFDLVKGPGGREIDMGRYFLVSCFSTNGLEIIQKLAVPSDKPLALTKEEFRGSIMKEGVLQRVSDPQAIPMRFGNE